MRAEVILSELLKAIAEKHAFTIVTEYRMINLASFDMPITDAELRPDGLIEARLSGYDGFIFDPGPVIALQWISKDHPMGPNAPVPGQYT